MDKWLFSHSPSLYAILSGTFIAITINLLTGLFFTQKSAINEKKIIIAIVLFFLSSGIFAYISLVLEKLRDKATGHKDLLTKIYDRRKSLRSSIIFAIIFVLAGIILLSRAIIS